jgi:fluoride exporter
VSTALLIALGGLLGCVSRYLAVVAVHRFHEGGYPVGTFAVNVVGCFLVGLALGDGERGLALAPGVRAFVVPGFLGGFTTFSAFGYETVSLLRDGSPGIALANVALSVAAGLIAVWLGMSAARLI